MKKRLPIDKRFCNKKAVNKINPDTLEIIETYDCINSIINNAANKKEFYEYNQLYRSIIKNNVYKNYRWKYQENNNIEQTNKITKVATRIEPIIKLNKEMSVIIKVYKTKIEIRRETGLSHERLMKIINNKLIYDNCYYVTKPDCKINIENDIKYLPKGCKKIKLTNVETKKETIYNSMVDIYKEYGLSRDTIKNYIKSKVERRGYLWEFA